MALNFDGPIQLQQCGRIPTSSSSCHGHCNRVIGPQPDFHMIISRAFRKFYDIEYTSISLRRRIYILKRPECALHGAVTGS